MYELLKIHAQEIYHYPQQQLFTYRVTKGVSAAAAATEDNSGSSSRQYSVSKYIHCLNSLFNTQKQYTVSNIFTHRFKSDDRRRRLQRRRRTQCTQCTQCNVNARRLQKCPLYIVTKHLFSIVSQALAMGNHCNSALQQCTVSSDIIPSPAACTGRVFPLPPTCHTRRLQRLLILIYKCYTPANTHSQLTAIANNTVIMSLLQAVEQYLGSINTWPAYIITYLIAETPSPRVVEELTPFFSGHGVPKTLAYRLYGACNPEAATELVRHLFYARFSLWHSSDTVRRHSMYYHVRIKKHVRLNVPYFT